MNSEVDKPFRCIPKGLTNGLGKLTARPGKIGPGLSFTPILLI